MEHRSLALVLALAMLGPTIAGCVQDLERRHLDAGWEAEIALEEAPNREAHGAPAMLVVAGTVSLPDDANVTVTGFGGELTRQNASIPLEAMRVDTAEGTQRAGEAAGGLALSDGEAFEATFVPADDAERRANPELAWNASIEIQWRYRDGTAFDAGRLEVDRNLTPERIPDLGVGVVEREDGEASGLLFEAIDAGELPDDIAVEILQVGAGSVETIERVTTPVNRSDGTVQLGFPEPVSVPEGSGYLVFRLDGPEGTASTSLEAGEDPVPGPGLLVLLVSVSLAFLVRSRRKGEYGGGGFVISIPRSPGRGAPRPDP